MLKPVQCTDDLSSMLSTSAIVQNCLLTVVVVCGFVFGKTTYDNIRKRWARMTVVVIGAGPVGLISTLIACKSGKASRVLLYEEKHRYDLLNRPQQIALDPKSVSFLQALGVDFDNIEGCWHSKRFFTRIGTFQEYVLSILDQLDTRVERKLSTKFTKDSLKDLDAIAERVFVVVCDGVHGHAANLLGLSDEFVQQSCRAYGAVASIDKSDQRQIPTQEIRIHNLTFDLNAYGHDPMDDPVPHSFHLKIFGSLRHRYLSLAVPKCDSKIVKALKVVLDQSVMRNIFQACFNAYRSESESELTDKAALKSIKFSPRLFEIKLSHRMENVVFIEDANIFVTTEGEASRTVNFHSGMDVNLGIRGLISLEKFIRMAATAEREATVMQALKYKLTHSRTVTQDFIKNGLRESMYT